MNVLWCGSEDVDFPGGATIATAFGGGDGYARAGVNAYPGGLSLNWSNPFPAGAVTSCWLTFHVDYQAYLPASTRIIGLGSSAHTDGRGLYIGSAASDARNVACFTYDGSTQTQLASDTSLTWGSIGTGRIDVQVISYGSSGTVNVYGPTGSLLLTYTGNIAVSGVTNLDTVFLAWPAVALCGIIVADSDTRQARLVTLVPNGPGTTQQWPVGSESDINEIAINDATVVNTNVTGQDMQFTLSDLPAGTFQIAAVKIAARASATAGATATKLGLGVNSGGSVNAGTPQALTAVPTTYERLMNGNNPVTSAAWQQSEINPLQLNLHSSS